MTFTTDNYTRDAILSSNNTNADSFTSDDLKWIIHLQNEERQSVALQLRDSIGQVLTCCKLLLETRQPANEQRVLELVRKHLQQTIGDIMNLSYKMAEKY